MKYLYPVIGFLLSLLWVYFSPCESLIVFCICFSLKKFVCVFISKIVNLQDIHNNGSLKRVCMISQLWSIFRKCSNKLGIHKPHGYTKSLDFLFKKTVYFSSTSERCATVKYLLINDSFSEGYLSLIFHNMYVKY